MESGIRFKIHPMKIYKFPMRESELTWIFLVKAKWKNLINFIIKGISNIKNQNCSEGPFFLVLKAEKCFSSSVHMEIEMIRCPPSLKKENDTVSSSPTTFLFSFHPGFLLTHFLFTFNPLHWNVYPYDFPETAWQIKLTYRVTSHLHLLKLPFHIALMLQPEEFTWRATLMRLLPRRTYWGPTTSNPNSSPSF